MTIDQLKYFLAIAQCLNYSQAAKQLLIAQPALSQSISRLEMEIGYRLFEKKGRGIVLSEYGKHFLPYAQMALNNINDGINNLEKLANSMPETIKLAINNDINTSVFSDFMVDFYSNHNNFNIHTISMDYMQVIEELTAGQADYCLSNLLPIITENPNLDYTEISSHYFYAYISCDNPLSKNDIITREQLLNENVIARGDNMKSYLLEIAPTRKPESIMVVQQDKIIHNLVANNCAIHVCDSDIPTIYNGMRISKIPFDCPPRKIVLVWNNQKNYSAAAIEFRNCVKKYFAD